MKDMTEREQAETLAASEVRYRRLFETAQDGILLLDAATGEIEDANPFLEELLGYTHTEMIGRKLSEIGPFQDVAASQAAFEKLQEERYVRYEDLPLQTKDGKTIEVEFVSNVYAVGDEEIIQCNIRDITKRKRAEEALTVSEVRYRRLFETAQDGILLLHADSGEIVDANPFLEDLLGYTHDEMIGRKLWEIGPFQDVAAAQATFEKLQQERYVRYEDLPLQTKDGNTIEVEFVSNVYAVDGEQIIQCNIRDITKRKRAEAALAVSEIRYRRLFETAQDGILLVHAHTGEIVDANPFLEDLLGYTHDEMIGRKLWEMGPFKDVAAAQATFEQLQHEKYVRYEDLPLQTKGGRGIEVEFVSNVYGVNGGQIIQCNIRDITARKHAEDQLHALRLSLEDRVEERTVELAQANLALQREIVQREHAEAREHRVVVEERTRIAREIHDTLAQGFTGIIIQLEVAEAALGTQPEAARLHVLKARTLARESLAEARRSVWALRPLALEADDLGTALLHLVHKLAEESGTPISFEVSGVLPPLDPNLENHLLRIAQEALTNALRYAHAAEIRVILASGGEGLDLSVEDGGDGFDVGSPAHHHGLGLCGMQERADSVGGKLTITSAPGQGTRARVFIALPRDEGDSLGDNQPDQDSGR